MVRKWTSAFAVILILFSLTFIYVTAEVEECSWKSFRNNPQNTGAADCEGPSSASVLWVLDLSEEDYFFDTTASIDAKTATVFISGSTPDYGTMFALDLFGYYNGVTASSTNISAVNLSSAEVKWKSEISRVSDSSPAFEDGIVYYGDTDGYLNALDAGTGDPKWSFKTGSEIHSSPVIYEDSVIIGSYDNHLYSIDRSNGTENWNYSVSYWLHATPAIADGKIFSGFCGDVLNIINISSGDLNTQFACRSYVISSPAASEGHLYFGDYDGYFYSVKTSTHEEVWNVSIGSNIYSSPAVGVESVYFGADDGYVYALNRNNGSTAWRFKTGADVKSSPVSAGETVYVGSSDGFLYALNSSSGEQLWKYDTGDAIAGSPAVAEGLLVIATTGGKIFCFGETNITAPSVIRTYPLSGEIDIPTNTSIMINFSLPMDNRSVESNFTIDPFVEGNFSWENNTLYFIPKTTFAPNTNYTIVISANTTDITGNRLEIEYNWSFITAPGAGNGGSNGGNGGNGDYNGDEEEYEEIIFTLTPIFEIIFIGLALMLVIVLLAIGVWYIKKHR